MTTSSLCLLCALAGSPPASAGPVYVTSNPDHVLIRAQSPVVHSTAPWGSSALGRASPWVNPVSVRDTRIAQQPYYYDPFLEPNDDGSYGGPPRLTPQGVPPIYNQFGGPVGIAGINGPQPFRYGLQPRFDVGYLPGKGVSNGQGKFAIFELDSELRNTVPVGNSGVFSYASQFGLQTWDGPTLVGGGTLPSVVYSLGTDLEWTTSASGPWSMTLGLTPSLNTDFERSVTSNAFNVDARAMLYYRASAEWMYVFGIGYLDRVNDRVLPYSGVVWTPNGRTELRLMFPESRLSYYLGNYFNDDKWLYTSAGFHVDAYEVEIQRPFSERREKIEMSDWRAVIGLRSENEYLSSFIEGGVVFDRQVDFLNETPGFDISSGFILRGGLRF